MSNPDFSEVDDPSVSARPAGRGYSAVVTVGLGLVGLIVIWTASESSESAVPNPSIDSSIAIHWRQNPVFSLAWSPDGRKVAASCFGPAIRVWDRETGSVSEHRGGTEQPRFVVGWSDDSRELMVSGLDIPVESWNLLAEEAGNGPTVGRPADRKSSIATLIRTTGSRPIRLWGPSDRRFGLSSKSGKWANSIAFSSDGKSVAMGGLAGHLEIRDPDSGELRRTIEVDARGITAVSFSPDGSKVATGGPGPVRIWDVESGREVARVGEEQRGSATLGFSPDGKKLALARWDGSIEIWDLATTTASAPLLGHHGQILTLAWSPDGNFLASGGYDSTVRIWDLEHETSKMASR